MSAPDNPHILNHKARMDREQCGEEAGVSDGLASLLAAVGSAEMFHGLIHLLPQAGLSTAVFAVDADRNIVAWNDGAEQLLGFPREAVLGRYCLTANRCHQCMLGCGISEYGAVARVPLVLLNADGEQVRVRKTARAFFDAEHRFIGGIEVLVPDEPEPPVATPAPQSAIELLSRVPAVAPAAQTPQLAAATAAVLRKLPSPRTLSDAELKLKVQEALIRADGHIGRAAELLGVSRPTLWRWRKRLGVF